MIFCMARQNKLCKATDTVLRGRPEMTSSFGGRVGVSQKMTVDDRGEGGSKPNYDAMK